MITEIEIEGFKSFERVRLKLGGLNLFIGSNASGKSNFFDSLRVLQGVGIGLTVDEIFNGRPAGAGNDVWQGIRGGSARASFARKGTESGVEVIHLSIKLGVDQVSQYSVRMEPIAGSLASESLQLGGQRIFGVRDLSAPWLRNFLVMSPAISLENSEAIGSCIHTLTSMQRLDPYPAVLRQYSQARRAQQLGEQGENFAALVNLLLDDEDLKSDYLSWLRQLTPLELDEVTILKGALGEPLFALREGDSILPAPILSDGTLRFAAITAAFFQPDMPGIITLEEIENGIHPSRLRLLLELLKSQSGGSGPQVFATTHSPVVLAWLDEKDYETTFLCKRDEETGASIITPLSEIPHLIDLVRKQPIGELFTEGWLEGAF